MSTTTHAMLSSLPATAICGVGVAYLVLRASCKYLWGVLYEHNLREATVVRDLPRLAETPSTPRGRTCVVIGGSLAGCIAAGAMSKMFDTVVLIDPLIDEEEPKRWRTQVAQLNQVHGFLPTSVQGLQLIFPGAFEKAVMRRGGRLLSMSESPMENLFNHGYVKYDENLATIIAGKSDSLPMSRWTLQQVVRELLRDTPSVMMAKGRVTRFKYREASVCGVLFDDASGVEKSLDCDLVLDCSGPKRAFRKLIAGYPRFSEPVLTVYNLPMTYSTAIFDIHPSLVDRMPVPDSIKTHTTSWRDLGGVSMVLPHLTQVGDFHMMYRGEGNKLTLGTNMFTSEGGRSYDEVPATIDAYRRAWKSSHFAQTGQEKEAWFDETMDLLEESDRLHEHATPFFKLRETQSYAYQIDASGDGGKRGLPDNLAIVGDAFAKLNPTFGQGCSKAMADVATLYTSLLDHERIADAVCDFDKRRQARTMAMFETNMVFDFGFESVQKANPAHPSSKGQLMRWFSKGFLNAIIKTKDPNLGNSFVGVTLGALPPLELMRPSHVALSLFARRFWDCSP